MACVRQPSLRPLLVSLLTALVALVALTESHFISAQSRSPVAAARTNIPYADGKAILEILHEDLVPPEFTSMSPRELESTWADWIARRDLAIRTRLLRADEDSVVNFLLYGTTFTKLARATERDLAEIVDRTGELATTITGRIDDLIAGIKSPGTNERLQFARQIIERNGIDPAAATGTTDVRRYLHDSLMRISAEMAVLSTRRINDVNADLIERLTRFRDRGLSSDTSIFSDFAIEQALEALKVKGLLAPGSVRRVAIIGPGLDLTDKLEGHDFYPQQTSQPFAAIDSLIRLGLATSDQCQVTAFDLSARVNRHLEAAVQRARAGGAYTIQFPRDMDLAWAPGLVAFWRRVGDRIGEEVQAVAVPPGAGSLQIRAVGVRPATVMSVMPLDLNIVLQRLEPLAADEQFDLIIATNVLAYYDVFEQSLAFVNVAKMLRSGGFFLTNNGIFELPPIPMQRVGEIDVPHVHLPGIGEAIDRVFWYRRQ
jgi:hypothetical protein